MNDLFGCFGFLSICLCERMEQGRWAYTRTRTAYSMQGELSFLRSDFCEFSWSVDIEASTSAFSFRLRTQNKSLVQWFYEIEVSSFSDLTEIFSKPNQ